VARGRHPRRSICLDVRQPGTEFRVVVLAIEGPDFLAE
jgi:hypothetical protein